MSHGAEPVADARGAARGESQGEGIASGHHREDAAHEESGDGEGDVEVVPGMSHALKGSGCAPIIELSHATEEGAPVRE